ncbi:MAG: glycosyltransferase [Calditrichaeota bacterium]|nr:MAG: glycosyltransferase [Calditrichota bacterium]
MVPLILAFLIPALSIIWFSLIFLIYQGVKKSKICPAPYQKNPAFSIIIAARNESQNICRLISALQNQEYPHENFELILVLNNCLDNTEILANKSLQDVTFRYQLISLAGNDAISPKKQALWHGANLARNPILVFTDADCFPQSKWLRTLAEHFTANTEIVIAFAPLKASKMNLVEKVAQFDAVINNLAAAAGVGLGFPFMANGRNIAIKRELYLESRALPKLNHIISGDDDLLVQKLNNFKPLHARFCFEPSGHVHSFAPSTFYSYLMRRGRHVSVAKNFHFRVAVGFGIYQVVGFLLLILPIFSITEEVLLIFMGLTFLRIAAEAGLIRFFLRQSKASFSPLNFIIWLFLSPLLSVISLIVFYRAGDKWPVDINNNSEIDACVK